MKALLTYVAAVLVMGYAGGGEFVGGIVTGWLTLIGYGAWRAVNSDGWDDSNILNWLRVFSHLIMHPEDFAKMYYITLPSRVFLDQNQKFEGAVIKPFPYLKYDEFSENFPTSRPPY